MNDNSKHVPVLLHEAIEGLNINPNGIYVDCTLGGAGHSSEILKRLNSNGHLYAFEQDQFAIGISRNILSAISDNYTIINDNFVNLASNLEKNNVTKVDGILYDLGISSFQLIADRGFSYNSEARLDMRMNKENELSAYEVVNYYSKEELKRILYCYGEEKFGANIANRIVLEREKQPIETTFELVEVIKKAIPAAARRTKGHPAKKTFQAIRIAVNDELRVFEESLKQALKLLNPGGRIAVITFHSLEDRICKNLFKDCVEVKLPRGVPILDKDIKHEYRLVNKNIILPSETEIENNNRAHSAKLRIIEKL